MSSVCIGFVSSVNAMDGAVLPTHACTRSALTRLAAAETIRQGVQ
jgi:hypothetical protein